MTEVRRYRVGKTVHVEMSRGAEILRVFYETVENVGDLFFVEAEVDPTEPTVGREIHFYGVRCGKKNKAGGKLIASIPYGTRTWPDAIDVFDFGEVA